MLDGFLRARVMEHSPGAHLAAVRAAAVHEATAPVVVFAEDHCYPDPEWADALIRAHDGPWAAVGPQFDNANPASMISWADFFLNFGSAAAPATSGVTTDLAWHNTSYKRSLLIECGGRLEQLLETEGLLQADLRERGHELWLEARARTAHVNVSTARWFVASHFVGGRLYGANRAKQGSWSVAHRSAYVAGGVLTPLARAPRLWREIRRTGRQRELLPRMIPALILGLAAHAIGEMAGYARGIGDASERKSNLEFNRYRYVTERDRAAIE